MTEGPTAPDAHTYIRRHQDHHPHLVGFARTFVGTPSAAEDAVAEAYFVVWRRLRSGQSVGDVPAALKAAVRDLALAAASRDRGQTVSYAELLAGVIEDLPQRWVKALWQAEAERQAPVASTGRRGEAGVSPAAALERARDGMRQHFLRAQPGAPADPACGWCWERLPEHVRGVDSPSQAEQVAVHVAGCADCRARMERLMAADARLPALVGPALMVLLARGTAEYLVPLAREGGAVAALSSGGAHAAPATVKLATVARTAGNRVRGRATRAGRPVAVAAAAGALALAGAAVAAGLVLTNGDSPGQDQRTAASTPSSAPSSDGSSPAWGAESARSGASGQASGDASSGRSAADGPSSGAADRSPSPSTPSPSASSARGTTGASGAPQSASATPAPSAPTTGAGGGGKATATTPTRPPATQPTPTRTQSATPKPTQTPGQTASATPEPTASPTESPAAEPGKPAKSNKTADASEQPSAPGRGGANGWDNN
ncbi:zf-HC2 domain-containing protein [Streptomyces sp. NPDC059590]|uniref:zf-HC2 domain-containing protein n=1 Tax=Streptomyces sp. NPDC059590 TaxID=3346877 RepID=UPI0036CE1C8D